MTAPTPDEIAREIVRKHFIPTGGEGRILVAAITTALTDFADARVKVERERCELIALRDRDEHKSPAHDQRYQYDTADRIATAILHRRPSYE